MALLWLARNWAASRAGEVRAFIVDHRLRPESSGEAALAKARAEDLGVAAQVLVWGGPKPSAGLQEAARAARYAMLAEACRRHGILHLLLAHHRADQAETVELRRGMGSGAVGLAGMSAIREVQGLRLLRPLLAIRPERLKATLAMSRLDWIEDPSNQDPRFARPGLRGSGFDAEGALGLASRSASERIAIEQSDAAFLAEHAAVSPFGYVTLDLGEDVVPAGVLRRLLLAVSGQVLPPRRAALERLQHTLRVASSAATLGGCLVRRVGSLLRVVREPATIDHVRTLRIGEAQRWDGRFRVRLEDGPAEVVLRALGTDGRAQLDPVARRESRRLPPAALLALPSLWKGAMLLWSPVGSPEPSGLRVAWRFGPTHPVAGAPFVEVNVVSKSGPLIYPLAVGSPRYL
jgi:tRNA(Ile)-lysidine synthase